MQGVFYKKHISGFHDLRDIVVSHKGRVYLLTEQGAIKILTSSQNKEYLKKKFQMSMLGFDSSHERIVVLEKIKTAQTKNVKTKRAEGPLDWYTCYIRPKTKKELKELVAKDPANIQLEATSQFGDEFDGSLSRAPIRSYYVVGPDPRHNRSWYAEIIWSDKRKNWIVK